MADIKQNTIPVPVITQAVEQQMVNNVATTGVIPSLSTLTAGQRDFVPFVSTVDGVVRMKNPGPAEAEASENQGDTGGLFVLDHDQPSVLEWVMMDLGAVEAYTVSIVTTAGEWEVASGTAQFVVLTPSAPLMPGESIKITAADPGVGVNAWMRIYVRSDQARH